MTNMRKRHVYPVLSGKKKAKSTLELAVLKKHADDVALETSESADSFGALKRITFCHIMTLNLYFVSTHSCCPSYHSLRMFYITLIDFFNFFMFMLFSCYVHVCVVAEQGSESYSSEAEKITGRRGIAISSTTNGSRPSNSTFDAAACSGAESDYQNSMRCKHIEGQNEEEEEECAHAMHFQSFSTGVVVPADKKVSEAPDHVLQLSSGSDTTTVEDDLVQWRGSFDAGGGSGGEKRQRIWDQSDLECRRLLNEQLRLSKEDCVSSEVRSCRRRTNFQGTQCCTISDLGKNKHMYGHMLLAIAIMQSSR